MEVHIGQIIERVYNEKGMKLSHFANAIDTVERNVYSIFKRRELKTELLQKISKALEYDFFKEYSRASGLVAEEPQEQYTTGKDKVAVMVELDGLPETLKKCIDRLTKINSVI